MTWHYCANTHFTNQNQRSRRSSLVTLIWSTPPHGDRCIIHRWLRKSKSNLIRIEENQENALKAVLGQDAFDRYKKSNSSIRQAPPN